MSDLVSQHEKIARKIRKQHRKRKQRRKRRPWKKIIPLGKRSHLIIRGNGKCLLSLNECGYYATFALGFRWFCVPTWLYIALYFGEWWRLDLGKY